MGILNRLAAFAAAMLSGMGVGGGGLFLLWLLFVTHTEQKTAQGINLLFFAASAVGSLLAGAISDAMKKENTLSVDKKTALSAILPGGVGAFLGICLAEAASPALLRRCFGLLLILAGVGTLLRQKNRGKGR